MLEALLPGLIPVFNRAGGIVVDPNNLLLLHFDGVNGSTAFPDSSLNNITVTHSGGSQLSNTQAKFGATSCNLNTGGFSWANTLFNSLTAFTIDFWGFNFPSSGTPFLTISCAYNATYSRILVYNGLLYSSSDGASWNVLGGAATNFTESSSAWIHYAIVWTGTQLLCFQNGTSTATVAWTLGMGVTGTFSVGGFNNAGFSGTGFVDEFRFSKIARWTANFTPPTGPYT
jgi:hypothetical protein